MVKNSVVRPEIAVAQLLVVRDAVDVGPASFGTANFYEGLQPSDPDASAAGSLLIYQFDLSKPAFSVPADSNPGAECTMNGTPIFALALANTIGSGIAWVRFLDTEDTAIFDGSCGVTAGQFDVILTKLTFILGEQLQLNDPYTLHQNEGPGG